MILTALAAGVIVCTPVNVGRYIGRWQNVADNNEYIEIVEKSGGVSVNLMTMNKAGKAETQTLDSTITVDGKLFVFIKRPYATLLDVDKSTGDLHGGEQVFKKK